MAPVTTSRRFVGNALFLTLGLPFLSWSCTPAPPTAVPVELVGTWGTEAPKYADRKFEIWDDAVIFYTGERWNDFTVHRIESVDVTEGSADGTLVALEYRGLEGTVDRFSFFFDASTGVLRFQNQRSIPWRKVGPPSWVD